MSPTDNPIRTARKARRLTVRELSRRIGVSPSVVSDWENEKKVPEPANAKALIVELPRLTLNAIYANVQARAA